MMEWSNQKVLLLIAEYKARTMLWDYTDPDYKNRHIKKRAWEELGGIFHLPHLEIERKCKILLVQYRREKMKILKMIENGHSLAELESRAWYAYKSFGFLERKSKIRRSPDIFIDLDSPNAFNETDYEEIKMEEIEPTSIKYESNVDNTVNFLENTVVANVTAPESKRFKLTTHNDVSAATQSLVTSPTQTLMITPKQMSMITPTQTPTITPTSTQYPREISDDIELFASYVASEMRSLCNPQLRRKLKTKILKAILEIREEDDVE